MENGIQQRPWNVTLSPSIDNILISCKVQYSSLYLFANKGNKNWETSLDLWPATLLYWSLKEKELKFCNFWPMHEWIILQVTLSFFWSALHAIPTLKQLCYQYARWMGLQDISTNQSGWVRRRGQTDWEIGCGSVWVMVVVWQSMHFCASLQHPPVTLQVDQ